ncbi:hypothetical protein PM082_006044 [Marasmius tenuissimus]|nr:hypothetical protein PM082_006044 [Marasmius tenuissimus]
MTSSTLPFRLDGDVAIVSGAGSALSGRSITFHFVQSAERNSGQVGNGRATAITLARQGAKVALLDYDLQAAEETKRMIDEEGGISQVIQCDVSDEDACRTAVEKTVELFGKVNILVNVVGIFGAPGNAIEVDLDGWDRVMKVNVKSMVMMSRFAIPEMIKQGGGSIVNLSSVSGLVGGTAGLLYSTSKGTIVQLTRAMAADHGSDRIRSVQFKHHFFSTAFTVSRVNCVAPGAVYTPMVQGPQGMSNETRKARAEASLLKIEGTAWDVAHAILYLASHEARYITGVVLPVDGGVMAGSSFKPGTIGNNEVDPYKKPQDLLEVSPKGLVPGLKFNNFTPPKALNESTVILEYLNDAGTTSNGRSLLPPVSNPYARALVRLQCDHISRSLVPAFYRYLQAQDPEAQIKGGKDFLDSIETLVSLFERTEKEVYLDHKSGAAGEGERQSLRAGLGLWVEDNQDLGMADVMAGPWLFRATNVLKHYRGFELPSGTKFNVYIKRLFENPAFKSTCSTEELYLDSYERYAFNRPNTSQVANAINSGRGLP